MISTGLLALTFYDAVTLGGDIGSGLWRVG